MELALGPCFLFISSDHFIFVSILVFVELALGPVRPVIFLLLSHVSILVFVELALGLWISWPPTYRSSDSFNPCFRGTCPRTLPSIVKAVKESGFQSLFSWNLPSDDEALDETKDLNNVSILVFVELALGPGG